MTSDNRPIAIRNRNRCCSIARCAGYRHKRASWGNRRTVTAGNPSGNRTDNTNTRNCRRASAGRSDSIRSGDCCYRIADANYLACRRVHECERRLLGRFARDLCGCWLCRIVIVPSARLWRRYFGRCAAVNFVPNLGCRGPGWRRLGRDLAHFALASRPSCAMANHLYCRHLACYRVGRRRLPRSTRARRAQGSSLIVKFSWLFAPLYRLNAELLPQFRVPRQNT